jgi:two-component system response regulator HupR/HoxA
MLERSALKGRQMSSEAMNCLLGHAWPGNVRELQNEVGRALALGDGPLLGADLLSPRLHQPGRNSAAKSVRTEFDSSLLKHQLERLEAQVLREAMLRHKGNKTRVAEELGLTRVGLRMKLIRLGLEKDRTPF